MAAFIDANLLPNETILYRAKISLIVFLPALVPLPAAFFVWEMLLLVPVLLAYALIRHRTTELAITNRRVIRKVGFIWRETAEIPFTRIESVGISQSVLDRLFDSGTIRVQGIGTGEVLLPAIDAPLAFRARLNELLEERRVTRGS